MSCICVHGLELVIFLLYCSRVPHCCTTPFSSESAEVVLSSRPWVESAHAPPGMETPTPPGEVQLPAGPRAEWSCPLATGMGRNRTEACTGDWRSWGRKGHERVPTVTVEGSDHVEEERQRWSSWFSLMAHPGCRTWAGPGCKNNQQLRGAGCLSQAPSRLSNTCLPLMQRHQR